MVSLITTKVWQLAVWSLDRDVQTDFQVWKIYLDTCCLSRLFDPPTQARIRQEAEAMHQVLTYCFSGRWHCVVSSVLSDEVDQSSNFGARFQIKNWITLAHQTVSVGSSESERGIRLEVLGFKRRDALHLACAESAGADIFLTTDDRLLRRAKHYQAQLHTQVENPYIWLQSEA